MNKYLLKIAMEKQAIIGTAVASHLLQNVGSSVGLRSRHGAKYIAGGFAHGWHGMKEGTMGAIKDGVVGAISPDTAIAKKKMSDLGRTLHAAVPNISKRHQVGLRMLSEGRFKDLYKHKLHEVPAVKAAVGHIDKHLGNDVVSKGLADPSKHEKLQKLWKDPSHPLLSNISRNLSRGKVGNGSVPGVMNSRPGVLSSVATAAAEPVAGAINMVKHVASSSYAAKNKYLSKATKAVEKHLITNPAKKGWNTGNKYVEGIKSKVREYGVNPASEQIRRTSAALSAAVR